MSDGNPKNDRQQFAIFLEELARGQVDRDKWHALVATHYHDELLESVRVRLVRLSIEHERQLRELASELTAATK